MTLFSFHFKVVRNGTLLLDIPFQTCQDRSANLMLLISATCVDYLLIKVPQDPCGIKVNQLRTKLSHDRHVALRSQQPSFNQETSAGHLDGWVGRISRQGDYLGFGWLIKESIVKHKPVHYSVVPIVLGSALWLFCPLSKVVGTLRRGRRR